MNTYTIKSCDLLLVLSSLLHQKDSGKGRGGLVGPVPLSAGNLPYVELSTSEFTFIYSSLQVILIYCVLSILPTWLCHYYQSTNLVYFLSIITISVGLLSFSYLIRTTRFKSEHTFYGRLILLSIKRPKQF